MTAIALQHARTMSQPVLPARWVLDDMARTTYRNSLLRALPEDVWDRILPHLQLTELPLGHVLYDSGVPVTNVYFPISAIVSLVNVMENGESAQTAMIGFEGMLGVSLFMGCTTWPNRAVVQNAGSAVKLRASVLAREFEQTPAVTTLLLRYIQTVITQVAQTAVCNRYHSIEQQLCRWLLTTLDRLPRNELVITHQLIAEMLGVRREGVTEAAGKLQRLGLISLTRGRITVVDRTALEGHVCECYSVVKDEAERMDLEAATPCSRHRSHAS